MPVRFAIVFAFVIRAMATTYAPGDAAFVAASRLDGCSITNFFGKVNTAYCWAADNGVRWTGNHTAIDVTVFDNLGTGTAGPVCLYQDGVAVGACYTPPQDNTWSTTSGQWTGLSGTHEYFLGNFNTYATYNSGNNYIAEIIVSGGSGLGAKPAAKQSIAPCGDSITVYVSTPITDSREGDFWQAALPVGVFDMRYGATGIQVSDFGSPAAGYLAQSTGSGCAAQTYQQEPVGYQWNGGVNDMDANATVGSASAACSALDTFKCAYYQMLSRTWAARPSMAVGIARGILPNAVGTYPSQNTANIATWNGYISSVVGTWNTDNPTKPVIFVDPAGWFNGATQTNASDHLHPLTTAYALVANHEIPIYASQFGGTAFSVSGPSSGTTGVINTFTLTPADTATFAGTADQTLTVTSSVAGDTVCIAASCAGHTVTAVISAGATAAVTLNASSAGSRTLAYSGLAAGWTAPSPTSFTASAPASGGAVMVGGVGLSGALGVR